MGCLLPKEEPKSNRIYNQQGGPYQFIDKITESNQSSSFKLELAHKENKQSLQLLQEDVSCLLTDSSLEDQEIYQIDEFLRQRKIKLQKKKVQMHQNRSYNDLNKVCQKEIKKVRSFSLGNIKNISISINNLYYEKFLNKYKKQEHLLQQQEQSQHQQQNSNLLDLGYSDKEGEREIKSLETSFSSMKELIPLCYVCELEIQQDQQMLECYHIYHTKCLEALIINQIEKDQTEIKCKCQKSIKTRQIKLILPQTLILDQDYKSNQHLEKLLKNQQDFLKSISE